MIRLAATAAIALVVSAVSAVVCEAQAPQSDGPSRSPVAEAEDVGFPIENQIIVRRCQRCHERDDEGRMSRISYERKTPEGWQTSIRRMLALNGVQLSPNEAREAVRYLANYQGLSPEELEPGRFEVERRLIDHVYEANRDVENTCIQCHSMGRVITQRRTREEWELLMATHRGLYPLVDFQAFRGGGGFEPMEEAIDHLSEAYPLRTPEWSAWSASMRPPRLSGTWALSGFEPGKGRLFGKVEITPGGAADEFRTTASWTWAETGETEDRAGQAIVYTGYQWRGRSNSEATDAMREVMVVDRSWRTMTGRWFAGAYDEFGPDVTLTRMEAEGAVTAVHPQALLRGQQHEVSVYGVNMPAAGAPTEFDFGPGVSVESVVSAGDSEVRLTLDVAADAAVGSRDLFAGTTFVEGAVSVHDGVDRIEVLPEAGMARVGGANFPKGYQAYDAIGWDDGADGEAGTEDDVRLGRVPVTWSLEEYTATFDDNDLAYVGTLSAEGTFEPAADGPNPERDGMRNNVGDVWVVATYDGGEEPLRARAHLIVTVPLYLRWEPWRGFPTELVP